MPKNIKKQTYYQKIQESINISPDILKKYPSLPLINVPIFSYFLNLEKLPIFFKEKKKPNIQ